MSKKVAVHVLGCKVNQYELEGIKELFIEKDYQIVNFNEKADIYLIHTCTITHLGDRKSRQYIRKAIKNNPKATIAVTGCYAQVSPQEIEKITGVDIILGTKDRRKIVEIIENHQKDEQIQLVTDSKANNKFEELPIFKPSRARAFIKIQEGCDRFCTYCIVPYARGPVKSRGFSNTISEIKHLVDQGFKEIVLTGVHIGTYGKDLCDNQGLLHLLQETVKIDNLKRLRISSLDPDEINSDIIKILTENEKICAHYHIPLQNGDDQILKRMGRRYTTDDYRKIINTIRSKRPDAAFTTDVIVGFPGETEGNFQNTVNFIEEIAFADLHVFRYSPRKGTPAAAYKNQVAADLKTRRSNQLISLANKLWAKYAQKFIGQDLDVLVEIQQNGMWEGHTENYLKVVFENHSEDLTGKIVKVTLDRIDDDKTILGR